MKNFYTTKEFAEELGLTDAYVRQLILGGKIQSEKVGRDHLIPAAEIEKARQRRTQRGPEPMKKVAVVESEPTTQPQSLTKPKMTIAQKKVIRDEQQKRWQANASGKKGGKP